ncbi:uncharacterized protein LOC119989000 [Tripterygium wilfordii]|uniref:uncharacterized protein LOC119989000 n=1 Tax=Tripterygium wilfordii TaxID=458696 RepID=UPI0018F8525B|nr:uncharacterized protein LOC119989000 [Tripterygium wilfordii]
MRRHQGKIVPRVAVKVEMKRANSGYWTAHWAGDSGHSIFQVTKRLEQYVANLNERSCSCRYFDLTGIPCCHAMSAIGYVQLDPEDFVNECYTKEAYMRAYEFSVMPTNGATLWPRVNGDPILLPKYTNAPGRPRKRKRREFDEPRTTNLLRRRYPLVKCSKCGVEGHNKRTCNGPNRREVINPTPQTRSSVASIRR